MANLTRGAVPALLLALTFLPAGKAAAAGGAPSPYESWFTDIDELHANWVSTHENPRLPEHKRRFCALHAGNSIGPTLGENSAANKLSFRNPPGSLNTGLCWMHSRYQRAASYLANFRPERPRPGRAEGERLVRQLIRRDAVVEIPGYRDLKEFSTEYRDAITTLLDEMGVACFLNPTDCLQRLGDSYEPSAEDLRATMDALYDQMLQQPGDVQLLRTRVSAVSGVFRPFSAHSLLVLSMTPLRDKDAPHAPGLPPPPSGYGLKTIDPNYQDETGAVTYRFGDRTVRWSNSRESYALAPYRHYEYAGDIGDFARAAARYCRP